MDRRERQELGWQEYEKLRRDRLGEYTAEYDAAAFALFFERCAEIMRTSDGQQFQYQVQQGALFALFKLADRNPDLFTTVVTNYIANGNVLELGPGPVVEKLVQTSGEQHAYKVLVSSNHTQKSFWLFAFFVSLPAEAVTDDYLHVLYSLYKSVKAEQVVKNFDYLRKFLQLDKSALIRVVETLVNRAKQEHKFGYPLTELFNPSSEIGQDLGKFFEGNVGLLQRAYFAGSKADTHHDYDGYFFNQLLDMDPAFSQNWVSWFFTHTNWPNTRDDSREYSFLWRRPDHMVVMEMIMDSIRAKGRDRVLLSGSYLQNFFVMTEGLEDLEEIHARQDAFCDEMIRRHNNDQELMGLLFQVISGFAPDRRRERIATFLQCNQDSTAFEHLPLYSSWWESYGGSAVPLLQKRVEFLESLIQVMSTVELLNHKRRIEHEIQSLREDIEREKRRDFVRDEI